MNKLCKKCKIEKPISEMVKSKLVLDGYLSVCKNCNNKRVNAKNFSVSVIEKKCFCCKKVKLAKDFPKSKQSLTGLYTWCKECVKEKRKSQDFSIKNEEKRIKRKTDKKWAQKQRDLKKESRLRNVESYMITASKNRAKLKNLEFNISKEDIIIPKFCPVLGIPIVNGTKNNYQNSPSLDRIDNSKGYIKGNIQVISMKANVMKSSASIEELQNFANWVLKTFK